MQLVHNVCQQVTDQTIYQHMLNVTKANKHLCVPYRSMGRFAPM